MCPPTPESVNNNSLRDCESRVLCYFIVYVRFTCISLAANKTSSSSTKGSSNPPTSLYMYLPPRDNKYGNMSGSNRPLWQVCWHLCETDHRSSLIIVENHHVNLECDSRAHFVGLLIVVQKHAEQYWSIQQNLIVTIYIHTDKLKRMYKP